MASVTTKYSGMTTIDLTFRAMRRIIYALGALSGKSVRVTVGDTVGTLPSATDDYGNPPIGALVTCEGGNVRFAFGTTPVIGASAVGHLLRAGQSFVIDNPDDYAAFKHISDVSGATGVVLQVTPKF